MRPISYEVDGFPEFIRSEEGALKIIKRGLLSPDTLVIAYGDNGERERMRAADHPLLGSLFARSVGADTLPVTPPEPAASEPTPAVQPAQYRQTPPPVPSTTSRYHPTADPVEERQDWSPTPATAQPKPWLVPVLVLGGLAGLAVIFSNSGSDNALTTPLTQASEPTPAPSGESPAEEVLMMYTTKPVSLRQQPSDNANQVTVLDRGTEITGTVLATPNGAQPQWLRVTQGPFTDSFLDIANLSPTEPPALDLKQAGTWYLIEDLVPVDGPEQTASPKSDAAWKLTAGQQVEVAGVTGAGAFFSGWAEVSLPDVAGVAYVPIDRLTQTPAGSTPTEETAEDTSAGLSYSPSVSSPGLTLRLQSRCSQSLGVILRYRTPSGLRITAVNFEPHQEGVLLVDRGPAQLVDDDIYFTYNSLSGEPVEEAGGTVEAEYKGHAYSLRPLAVDRTGSEMLARFSCYSE
jgi:hypothetical protein